MTDLNDEKNSRKMLCSKKANRDNRKETLQHSFTGLCWVYNYLARGSQTYLLIKIFVTLVIY